MRSLNFRKLSRLIIQNDQATWPFRYKKLQYSKFHDCIALKIDFSQKMRIIFYPYFKMHAHSLRHNKSEFGWQSEPCISRKQRAFVQLGRPYNSALSNFVHWLYVIVLLDFVGKLITNIVDGTGQCWGSAGNGHRHNRVCKAIDNFGTLLNACQYQNFSGRWNTDPVA